MNYQKLKSILISTNLKMTSIGLILLLFALGILSRPYFLNNNSFISVALTVLIGGAFLVLSIMLLKKTFVDFIKALQDTHPLLKAIQDGNRDYLVWVYQKQIYVTAGQEGPIFGASKNLAIFSKDCKGKGFELVLDNTDAADQLMKYLMTEFDIPFLGFADETREAVYIKYYDEGWPKI